MKLGKWDSQPGTTLQVIDDKLTEITTELELYYAACTKMDAAFERGELDSFVYDARRTSYDQVYQGHLNKRNRLLARRDRVSSQLAKAVLKQKT